MAGARNVLVVSHENPDADTLGAALCARDRRRGARRPGDAVCTDPVPELYAFLPAIERVRTDPEPGASYDLLAIVDCGSLDRVGAVRQRHAALFNGLPRVVVDHHLSNEADRADRVDRSRPPPRRAR